VRGLSGAMRSLSRPWSERARRAEKANGGMGPLWKLRKSYCAAGGKWCVSLETDTRPDTSLATTHGLSSNRAWRRSSIRGPLLLPRNHRAIVLETRRSSTRLWHSDPRDSCAIVLPRAAADIGSLQALVASCREAGFRLAKRFPAIRGSAPDRIRTCDLRFRRPTLYPTELRARVGAPGPEGRL
jgi:hypothetical protein